MSAPAVAARREEVRAGLLAVRRRIEAACAAAGRSPDELTLIVVTKTHPASDVLLLADLGVRDVGENRDQEASAKYAEVRSLLAEEASMPVRWHFIGRLQSNKARHVAGYSQLVHSVDRPSLIAPLDRGAAEHDVRLDCLVQVSLDGDPARGGAVEPDVLPLAERIAAAQHLRLRGVMAVAPIGVDPRSAFDRLVAVSGRLRAVHPDAVIVSAGMSDDLEAAVEAGATHLRVGSAVLGARPPLG